MLKPIAEVTQIEIEAALEELKQLVLHGDRSEDDGKEAGKGAGYEDNTNRGPGSTSSNSISAPTSSNIYDPLDMDSVMAAPEANFASFPAPSSSSSTAGAKAAGTKAVGGILGTNLRRTSSKAEAEQEEEEERRRRMKLAFLKGVGGGLIGGLGGAAATLWASHVVVSSKRVGGVALLLAQCCFT